MRVLLDTSVLVAAMVSSHPEHARALPWLQRAKRGELSGFAAMHTVAETYAILTRLPVRPPIPAATALRLVRENIVSSLEVVALTAADYEATIEEICRAGLIGGVPYDALIIRAARKANVDHMVTLNGKDFRRLCTDRSDLVLDP